MLMTGSAKGTAMPRGCAGSPEQAVSFWRAAGDRICNIGLRFHANRLSSARWLQGGCAGRGLGVRGRPHRGPSRCFKPEPRPGSTLSFGLSCANISLQEKRAKKLCTTYTNFSRVRYRYSCIIMSIQYPVPMSWGAGGQYRLVPHNSIFCNSDRSTGNRVDNYEQGD
jgi:hypothetical protein